jgi:hypothetical protein
MKKLTQLFFAVICVLSLQNCNDDDFNGDTTPSPQPTAEELRDQQFQSENFGNSTTGNFMGIIVDKNGDKLENVLVTVGNTTTLTDRNGLFIVNNAQVFENFAYVKAQKDGYLNGSRVVIPKTNGTNRISITLIKREIRQRIQSGIVSEVSLGTTKVRFAGDFITADGSPYVGPVDVSLHYVRPNDLTTFTEAPGNFLAQTVSNEARALETYGMVNVNLFSPSGELVNINPESPATITFPVDYTQAQDAPETIQLWYFDEAQGYWKEEGQAIKDGNRYVGEVTHFTWWNCDIPFDAVQFCFTLTPANNTEPTPYFVSIKRISTGEFIYFGLVSSYEAECGLIPRNEEIEISVSGGIDSQACSGSQIHQEVLGGYATDAAANITFQEDTTITPIAGIATNCAGDPITNGYIYINNVNTFNITDGTINIAVQTCANVTETLPIQLFDLDTNQWTIVNDVVMDGNLINIGNLSTCDETGGIYNGNVTLLTQSEVNSFGAMNFSTINGDLRIGDSASPGNISDITSFMTLEEVTGNLVISSNQTLGTLNGLENLVSVGGVFIQSNPSLESLAALSNLTEVDGILSVVGNNALTSLNGLNGITTAGSFGVISNQSLTSIDAMQSLSTVGRLVISNNISLNSIAALSNITTATSIQIIYMPLLTSLEGLNQLTTVTFLRISYNDGLTNLAELSNLVSAPEGISIGGNDALTSLDGLENLTTCNWVLIGRDLDFDVINDAPNQSLVDYCALQNLFTNGTYVDPPTSIFNGVEIVNNPFNPSIQDIIDGNCSQ